MTDNFLARIPARLVNGRRTTILLALALLVWPRTTRAGINEIMDAVQSSEFSFARSVSEVPFYPVGWAQDKFYPNTVFTDEKGVLPGARVVENTFNVGLVMPAYVAKRDLLLVGADLAWDELNVRSGPYADQSILRISPVAAWLHQFGSQETVIAFGTPILTKELQGNGPWGTSGYGGLIGMHWFSDQCQLLYGGVYEYSYGQSAGYPYLGVMWSPSPKWSVAVVFPWPSLTYAPRDRWLLQLGLAPGGSSWVKSGDGYQTTESLGSWNLTAGAGYRLSGKIWLFAGAGVAGLRGVQIESGGSQTRFDSQPGVVFTLALQFRP